MLLPPPAARRPPLDPTRAGGSDGSTSVHCSSVRSDGYPPPEPLTDFNERVSPRLRQISNAALTPNGADDVCHLQMEIDLIATSELRETFSALHAALVL